MKQSERNALTSQESRVVAGGTCSAAPGMGIRSILAGILIVELVTGGACINGTTSGTPPTAGVRVVTLPDLTPVDGASGKLMRFDDRIELTLETTQLTPGHAYTIWIFVFNDPSQCAMSPCAGDDFENEDVGVSLLPPLGAIADDTGTATFSGTLRAGDSEGVFFGPGLVDPINAEVSLTVRTHGPQVPDQLEVQLTTLDGGCPPNECTDVQDVSFHP